MNSPAAQLNKKSERFLSLDFFRGLTMFLLVAEFTGFLGQFTAEAAPSWLHGFGEQFHHVPWDGLRFWDLIQPYFMFIVGVAIPFAVKNRRSKGHPESAIRKHAYRRAFMLLLLGWWLYCTYENKIVTNLQDVLAQLSITYLIAFLLKDKKFTVQLIWSFALITVTMLLYWFFPLEGYNQPFEPSKNFGTWVDTLYGGQNTSSHWVSFNAIPTTAHTIWGVLCGQLLMTDKSKMEKLKILLIAGVAGLVIGYGLSLFIPIIKRTCTASFVIVSGGWTILTLAFCFWVIDILGWTRGVWVFVVVGMNPLFIYMFSLLGGTNVANNIVNPLTNTLAPYLGKWPMDFLASGLSLAVLWYLCYWLYKRKIFIKI